jgi:hypothetical protein
MNPHRILSLAAAASLIVSIATTAPAYVLLVPNQKYGDPEEPIEYRLNVARDETSIPGNAEFNDMRASYQVWQNEGTRAAFVEGPNHTNCNFIDNGLNELSFDECGGQCTGSCLAVTRSLVDSGDQMWQEGPDGTISTQAKRDSDILFNAGTNFWSPSEGNCVGNQFSVTGVAVHEIGHLLGLGHSTDPQATMEAFINPCSHLEETLYIDDVNGLEQLYSVASEEYVVHEHDNGTIAYGVNNAGNFGFSGQGGRWGRGFEFPIGTANLHEASVAIATPAGEVCDEFRKYGSPTTDGDFLQQTPVTVIDYTDPLQVASTQYDDSRAEAPYGVRITQRSFLFPAGPSGEFAILQYRIRNDSGVQINNLHVGAFMDWDLQGTFANNTASYDADLGLGWISDPSTTRQTGICVVNPEGVTSYRALYSANQGDVNERYSDANKKSWFFSGFSRTLLANNDVCNLIVTGPFTIPAGGTATAAFAILAGDNHADLRANCEAAAAKYLEVQHFANSPASVDASTGSGRLFLSQGRPNPVREATRIGFSLNVPGPVHLGIYDVGGRLVRTLVESDLTKEHYEVRWDRRNDEGDRVSPGVYFYRLATAEGSQQNKLLVLE